MTDMGFKKLSLDNWTEPDPVLRIFFRMEPNGRTRPTTGDDWARRLLEPQLKETVPTEIRRLFEVARSAMLYGYFFYPLYTLSNEQLYRVVETAVMHKHKDMNGPVRCRSFNKRLEWLVDKGAIPSHEGVSWHAIRELRNISSHPTRQDIQLLTESIASLQDVVRKINYLFLDE